jgi:O-antigen ligase
MNTDFRDSRLLSEEAFYRTVVTLLVGLPVLEFFTEILVWFNDDFIPSFFQPQVLSLFGIIGTLITAAYWVSLISQKRKIRIADIFYLALVFFMVISAIFSLNPGEYSAGYLFYCENPFHFLAYYWLYFAGTLIDNHKYRKNLLFVFIGVALFESIFAFLQTFDIELSYSLYYHTPYTAYGLTQNSNFYGGMCILFIACISGVYIFSDNIIDSKLKDYVLPAAAGFIFYTMIGSRARLAWVGFIALVIFYVISFIVMFRKDKDKKVLRAALKRALILMGVYFAVFLIAFFFTDYIREITTRSYWEVANGDVDAMGSDRIYNWRMGLAQVPKHWLTGVGLDNYRYVFVSDPGYHDGMYIQDKAHNEYLHTLVTQGVPSLVNYLALLIFAARGAVKSVIEETSYKRRAVIWILLGMFITYTAQALFNSSINYVVIYFWLVIGLIMPRTALRTQKS